MAKSIDEVEKLADTTIVMAESEISENSDAHVPNEADVWQRRFLIEMYDDDIPLNRLSVMKWWDVIYFDIFYVEGRGESERCIIMPTEDNDAVEKRAERMFDLDVPNGPTEFELAEVRKRTSDEYAF